MEKEERTPKEWIKNCLAMLQNSNPDFILNKNVKGPFIEFIRKDDSGIFVSVNFFRKRTCGEDDYSLCFALTLTDKSTSYLYHPLVAGSRFDHNRTIWRLLSDDLGMSRQDNDYPNGVWSFGTWRRNTMENLKQGIHIPEQILYPFYIEVLRKGKPRVLELFNRAAEIVSKLPKLDLSNNLEFSDDWKSKSLLYAKAAGIEPSIVLEHQDKILAMDLFKIAKGGMCWYGIGPAERTFEMDKVPVEAIIMNTIDIFLLERDRLFEIVKIIERL